MTAPALLTADEAAEYLGISRAGIYHRIRRGTLRLARVEHANPPRSGHPGRPETLWFTRAALEESELLMSKARAIPTDARTAAALRGVYRGPKLSDEHNAASYAQWVQARRQRLGGSALTF